MTRIFSGLVLGLVLASCGEIPTPDTDTAPPADASAPPAEASAQVAVIDGLSFRVTPQADRTSALVGTPDRPGSYTGGDIEAAAARVTGCAATLDPGEWAFLGDLTNFDLSSLRPNVRVPFPAWQVALSC